MGVTQASLVVYYLSVDGAGGWGGPCSVFGAADLEIRDREVIVGDLGIVESLF